MSEKITTATEYFNTAGIKSPVMFDNNVEVMILTDDMAASDVLQVEDENGKKKLFTTVFDPDGATYLISSVFALSALAIAIF